jgi:MFS family permease
MATRNETSIVYAAGVVQGVVLVTFPAASTIFTDPAEYDLSSTQYGALFLPQVVAAITTALLGAGLSSRFGAKRVYLVGLTASLLSMALLIVSSFLADDPGAYWLLLLATASLGAGFGLTVPTLNTFAAAFHPAAVDRSILVLNALLGLGTVLAPVFVAIFVGLGFWWGLPLTSAILLVALLAGSLRLPLRVQTAGAATARAAKGIPSRFWVYAGFAVLYGFCETVNGNWSQLDMTDELGASTTEAALALTAFWGMVTVGRVFFAAIQRRFPSRLTFHLLPFVLAGAFVIIAWVGLKLCWEYFHDAGYVHLEIPQWFSLTVIVIIFAHVRWLPHGPKLSLCTVNSLLSPSLDRATLFYLFAYCGELTFGLALSSQALYRPRLIFIHHLGRPAGENVQLV